MSICFEIVAYRVKDAAIADRERKSAIERARFLPGFVDWTAFTGATETAERVDLLTWSTREAAQAAAGLVEHAPEFAEFRATVAGLASMGHYRANAVQPALAHGMGLEIGRFRLKPGVDEASMRAAYATMVDAHLSRQGGWRGQNLAKLQDGTFVDIAFAESQERALEICESWHASAECAAFLALIEAESMDFGALL